MYLCSGIKQVVNVTNQTNRRLGMLMQNVFHSDPLIKQQTQGVKCLRNSLKPKAGLSQVSLGTFHHSLTPSYFQDNGIFSNRRRVQVGKDL